MDKIKYLFSDIGGVLLTNGWDHLSRIKAAETFHLDYKEMSIRHEFIFNTYEIGKITLDDYLDIVVFSEPRNFSRKEFKEFMFSQSHELPDMLPYLVDWKKRYPDIKVISINNEPRDLNQYRIEKFKLHRFFDGFISSCEVGMRKPDPGIFQLAIGIAQVAADQCIYFDDRNMIVKSAMRAGLDAHLHRSFGETKKILEDWTSK
jgi:putative hydrolase of the HAD superfamily